MIRAAAVVCLVAVAVAMIGVVELTLRVRRAEYLYAEVRRRPPHPFLQVLPGGQVDHVNAAGFRGDDVEPSRVPHSFRIVTLGGSTTIGVANPYDESYPYLLQQRLQARYPDVKIEVQNAGAAWYTTAHALIAYQTRVRRYDPDLIVFFEAINDLVRGFSPEWFGRGAYQPDYSHYLGPYTRLRGPEVDFIDTAPRILGLDLLVVRELHRAITRAPSPFNTRDVSNVRRVAARMSAVAMDIDEFRSLPSYREYYDLLVRNVRADGHAMLVLTQPFVYREDLPDEERAHLYFAPVFCGEHGRYPDMTSMARAMRAFNDAARGVAERYGVPVVDAEAAVTKSGAFFTDDVHLREAGNDTIARVVADRIMAEGFIDRVQAAAH